MFVHPSAVQIFLRLPSLPTFFGASPFTSVEDGFLFLVDDLQLTVLFFDVLSRIRTVLFLVEVPEADDTCIFSSLAAAAAASSALSSCWICKLARLIHPPRPHSFPRWIWFGCSTYLALFLSAVGGWKKDCSP